jgi:hypothetical protein
MNYILAIVLTLKKQEKPKPIKLFASTRLKLTKTCEIPYNKGSTR